MRVCANVSVNDEIDTFSDREHALRRDVHEVPDVVHIEEQRIRRSLDHFAAKSPDHLP